MKGNTMDLKTLVQKIRDLVNTLKSGSYITAFMLVVAIIEGVAGSLPRVGMKASSSWMDDMAAADSADVDSLTAQLDSFADSNNLAEPIPLQRPVIDLLLPILLALLRKLLGF